MWSFRKITRKRNIQGKDPRTFEANSQGGVPKTLERNSQGVVLSTSQPWDQGDRMQVRCILQEDRSKKETRWWRCRDPQIHQTARLGLPQWCGQQSRKPRSILFFVALHTSLCNAWKASACRVSFHGRTAVVAYLAATRQE